MALRPPASHKRGRGQWERRLAGRSGGPDLHRMYHKDDDDLRCRWQPSFEGVPAAAAGSELAAQLHRGIAVLTEQNWLKEHRSRAPLKLF